MKWTPDILDRIREAHDIVEWISKDTVLKAGSGGQYKGLCPFADHNEKTPSFSVSTVKQVYHCFGCQKSGDLFTYFREQKGMGFVESVQYLAQQAGISLQQPSLKDNAELQNRQRLLDINAQAAQIFHNTLLKAPVHHPVQKYLKQRGYSQEMIKKFQLGYVSQKGELLENFKNEHHRKILKQAGLVGQKNNSVFEFFRHRLMFPIISPLNQVLGFGGRALGDSLPKYINSKDSSCFHKGKVFYGLNQSAPFIRKTGYVLIVEGYTDYLTLFQNGFCNVTATLGTALTLYHARLLKRYTDKVVLFFDGDQAGEKAALRSLPILLKTGLRVHQAELKDMDPDECIQKKGSEFLKNIIAQNNDLFLHTFSKKLEHKQGVERLDVIREFQPILSETKDTALKEYYSQFILSAFTPAEQKTTRILLSQKHSLKKMAQTQEPESSTTPDPEMYVKIDISQLPKTELYLLVLSLHKDYYLEYVAHHLNIEMLSHSNLQKTFSFILKNYAENPSNFDKLFNRVIARTKPEKLLYTHYHPILAHLTKETGIKLIKDCLSRLVLNYENSRIKTLTMQLKLNQVDNKKYLEEIQNIKRKILSVENSYEK